MPTITFERDIPTYETNTQEKNFVVFQIISPYSNDCRTDGICLKTQLCSAPVTTLGVPLDLVICAQTDPLWQRAILTLLLGQSALGSECLLRWLHERRERDVSKQETNRSINVTATGTTAAIGGGGNTRPNP